MDKGSLVALIFLVTFLLLFADNLLVTEQVMHEREFPLYQTPHH